LELALSGDEAKLSEEIIGLIGSKIGQLAVGYLRREIRSALVCGLALPEPEEGSTDDELGHGVGHDHPSASNVHVVSAKETSPGEQPDAPIQLWTAVVTDKPMITVRTEDGTQIDSGEITPAGYAALRVLLDAHTEGRKLTMAEWKKKCSEVEDPGAAVRYVIKNKLPPIGLVMDWPGKEERGKPTAVYGLCWPSQSDS